ncbi:MAG: hypothetical protein L0287_31440 [Anaerolineae bacterium]|nr:hypothetical protein [Anaerolineae bacterium]
MATQYEQGDVPRPVEVRRRLERLGADINHLKDLYASGSEVAHVGRKSERFHSQWVTAREGKLLFGGAFVPSDQSEMFGFLPALLELFRRPMIAEKKDAA